MYSTNIHPFTPPPNPAVGVAAYLFYHCCCYYWLRVSRLRAARSRMGRSLCRCGSLVATKLFIGLWQKISLRVIKDTVLLLSMSCKSDPPLRSILGQAHFRIFATYVYYTYAKNIAVSSGAFKCTYNFVITITIFNHRLHWLMSVSSEFLVLL